VLSNGVFSYNFYPSVIKKRLTHDVVLGGLNHWDYCTFPYREGAITVWRSSFTS